jgi:hypothetical protein
MKFKVKWTASYETVIEADSLEEARDGAASIEVDVPGSRYVEDSWEVLKMVRVTDPESD